MSLTTIEKVIFLQEVDIFKEIPTEELAYLAGIAEEISYNEGDVIFNEGEESDSMFLVVDGNVLIHRENVEVMSAKRDDAFGTWSLFDEAPRVATALCKEDTTILKISTDDFYDVLADHIQISKGILRTVASRLRSLMNTFNTTNNR